MDMRYKLPSVRTIVDAYVTIGAVHSTLYRWDNFHQGLHQVLGCLRLHLLDVLGVFPWYQQYVAICYRVDVEERQSVFVLVYLVAGGFIVSYLAE